MPPDPESRIKKTEKSGSLAGGRLLALVPVAVALFLGALVLPRSAPPRDIPLPAVDMRQIARVRAEDERRVTRVRELPLGGNARELGSAMRAFNLHEAKDDDAKSLMQAREAINTVLPRAVQAGVEDLLALRAYHMETFLQEVRTFEETGKESDELGAVGGAFVVRMRDAEWCQGNTVLLSDDERRAAYKQMWNGVAGLERNMAFALSLDEVRELYTLYLRIPHLPEASRKALIAARHEAKDEAACAALDDGARLAIEAWRYEKIKKLGEIDPTYPLAYALGVSHYLRGQYGPAVESFRDFQRAHPVGPLALRTTNHLRAALEAAAF